MGKNKKWFHRGKEARRLGRPCTVHDLRVSALAKRAFYDGWVWQDRRMLTDRERKMCARMVEFVRKNLPALTKSARTTLLVKEWGL